MLLLLLWSCHTTSTTSDLPTCSVDPPDEGALSTDGTRIVDASGRRMTLRGVNTGGRSKFDPYLPYDLGDDPEAAREAYLDRAASWGLTVLRVPFSWAALEPAEGSDDADWLGSYDALLDGAAARGLWTIVDFHQDLYAEPLCGDGFPDWTLSDPGPDRHDCASWIFGYFTDDDVKQAFDDLWSDANGTRTAMASMWGRMAAEQAGRPGVIGYELLNEPFYGSTDEETWGADVMPAFYEQMGAAVRAEAPDSLLFFDASGIEATSAETVLSKPDLDDLVFAPHYYDAAVFLGGTVDPDGVDAAIGRWADQGAAWDLPVLLGEIGVKADSSSADAYARALFAALDARNLGETWWEYSDAADLWNEEDFSLIGPDGSEREALISAVARPTPRALAEADPDATAWSWDPDAETFTLDYDGTADGVSEITLPTWRYGGAATISGSGGCIDQRTDRVYLRADGGAVHLVVGR